MQPQAMAKGHLARKKHTNSKRTFNLPVVDLSRTQDVSNVTGNESQHIVNASSTSPLSSRYPRHSYGHYPQGGPPIHEEGHAQVIGRRQDGSYIYESHSPITARQSHSNSRRSLQSRKNSGVSQKSRAAAAVAALHYGRPTPPGHRPNQYSQRNISAFASCLNETVEENMQRVRESVYNRKKGLYSEVPISHAGRHTPTMPHPPPGRPGASRDASPAPGAYPHQTTFANFSKNASAIQKSHPLRSSEDMSRSQSKRQARLKRGLSGGLEQREMRSKTYVHTSTLHTPGGELAQTQTIGTTGGRNHLISGTQLMESGQGGSGILIHAQQGDSHERTKSYDRTLSPGIMKGGDTIKLSHKSFTGSSQVNEHTISVYDNKSRTFKSKTQQNSTNAATIAKLRNKLSKDRQTIPLDPINFTALQSSEYKIKEAKNPPANNEGMAVFSNRGLTLVGRGKDQPSDFISSQNFIIEETGRHLYGRIPFFRHFRPLKAIRMWRAEAARARYERKRERLARNFVFSKGLFSEHYPAFARSLHQLETLNCFDISVKTIYGKKQQAMLDQKSNKTLDKATKDVTSLLQRLRGIVDELKTTIGTMDSQFLAKTREEKIYKIVQKKKYDELIMFSQDRRAKLEQDDKERKLEHRRRIFDAFTELMLRIFSHKLVRLILDNTQSFHNTLLDPQGPEFELSVLFSREGKISTDPTIDEHKEIFVNLFLRLNNLVFENKRIFQFVQCLNNTFFNSARAPWHHKRVFKHIEVCLTAIPQYKEYQEVIFTKVEQDTALAAQEIQEYQHLEEIHEFMEAWKAANGGSLESSQGLTLEMGYYKETWARMDKYSSWIEKIPSYNTHINSIQIETANLKNTLSRLPKDIMKALRHNVTSTMEGETKALKSELVGKVMKTLERVPTDLNEFVKQIDMVKYVQLKQQDYEQRNNSIIKLYTLCKNDNIRVAPSLQLQIDEVQRLYDGLPKVLAQAKMHLIDSKENIEVIMLNSTITLSKKIKSFEKKYVQNYLQMPDRLSNTTTTLQELIRRTQAIQEIRSKVLHYKEFLKLLREDTSLLTESVVQKVGDEPNLSFTQQSISAAGDDSVLNASHQTPMLEQPSEIEPKEEKPLQCAMDFEFLNALHKTTSNLWKMLTYWQKRKEGFLANSLAKVDLKKIRHTIEKMVNFFESKIDAEPFIRDKSKKLVNKVKLEIKEMAGILEFFRELKKDSLRVRHWVQILNYIKRPQLINIQFSISDLRKAQIQNYQTEIREVIKKADLEYKYELLLTAIKHEWKTLELTVVPYKLKEEAYIITEAEAVFSVIDQHMTTLESVENSVYAIHVRDEIRRWIVDLKIMEAMLERWMDTQRLWISLEPIFSSTKGLLSQVLLSVEERAQFERINDKYMKVMWAAYRNPKATFTLLARNKISQFDDLLEYLRKIQQAVDAFMESRRLAFPRFFFLSDLQFLDFLSLVHQKKDFNQFIPILFPGASSVFLSRPLNAEQIPEMHYDPTAGPEMSIEASQEELAIQVSSINGPQEQGFQADRSSSDMRRGAPSGGEFRSKIQEKSGLEASGVWSQNESRQMKQGKRSTVREPSRHQHPEVLELDSSEILGSANSSIILEEYTSLQGRPDLDDHSLLNFPHEIMGFVSEHRELFMFDRRVELTNERAEAWLQLVEGSMQDSVGKMIHYAVSSFPKQSLDEWILDFPLQTILSTIHLILTHEINDLFEGMMRAIASGQNVNQLDDEDSYDSDSSISHTPRTPDTRNILKSSHALSSKSSQTGTRQGRSAAALPAGDDSDDDLMKQYKQRKQSKRDFSDRGGRRSSIMASKKDDDSDIEMADNRTNRSYDDQDEDELSEYEVNLEIERNRFASNMFGFDIDDSVIGPTKAETIKALQEKSFKGLYMRLQFWITQIQKSLYERTVNSEVKLPELQRHSMRTIITFLIYMRDVVNSLRKRGISSPDDNEWLKNVRLTCQQHQKLGCRVDCGNWSMQQANEYIGTSPRLLITPDTNRYFVHIASALREKSAIVARCVPAHDTASDVFKEFASLCTVPFQSFRASENTQMKLLMQYLNGAALASVWIFVEHMDRLKFEILQTFNKEVQMVQQQFIIAELSNNEQSLFNTGSLRMGGPPSQTASPQKDKQPIPSQMTEEDIKEGVKSRIQQGMTNISMSMSIGGGNEMSLIGKSKTCFGVFGSLSYGYEHRVTAGRTALTVTALSTMEKAKDLQYTLQSAYRVVQLIKPESENYLMFMLQAHGFKNPHEISRVYESFFQNMQNEYQKLRGSKPRILFLSREKERQSIKLEGVEEDPLQVFSVRASSTVRSSMRRQRIVRTAVEQHHDLITPNMRDMTVIIKLLSALFNYHQQQFLETRERRFKEKEPEMPVIEKKTKTKMMEKLNREKDEEIYRNERIQQIEVECLRKILQLYGQQRFFWMWKREADETVSMKEKSTRAFRKSTPFDVETPAPQKPQSGVVPQRKGAPGLKRATTQLAPQVPSLQAALMKAHQLNRVRSNRTTESVKMTDAQIILKLSKSIARSLKLAFLSEDAKVSEAMEAMKQVEGSPSVAQIGASRDREDEVQQGDSKARLQNIGSDVSLRSSAMIVTPALKFNPQIHPSDLDSIEALAAAPLAELQEEIEKATDPVMKKAITDCYDHFQLMKNNEQQSKAFMLYSSLRTYKLVAIVGPPCSGKSTLVQLLSGALKMGRNIHLRKAHLVPSTLEQDEIFGVTKHGQVQEGAISLIMRKFQEKQHSDELPVNCLLLDGAIEPAWADSFMSFAMKANKARMGLGFSITDNLGERHAFEDYTHVNLPNGVAIPFPSNAYIIFETLTLENATPSFVDTLCVISCDADNLVDWNGVLKKSLHSVYESEPQFFSRQNNLDFGSLESTAQSFLLPIINRAPLALREWRFWNMKLIALSFAAILRGTIRAFIRKNKELLSRDEPLDIGIAENSKLILESVILSSIIWSIGCMLPGTPTGENISSVGASKIMKSQSSLSASSSNLKAMFDELIMEQLKKFKTRIPVRDGETVFDYYFDPQRLQFMPFRYQELYTLKMYYDPSLNKMMLPTSAVTGALYLGDLVLKLQRRHHLFVCGGPSSQKSTILHLLNRNLSKERGLRCGAIPISGALTVTRLKQHIESFFYPKRKNLLVPKDEGKANIFMIDDVHLEANIARTQFLEFFRSWSTIAGYYDTSLPGFKQVKDFSLLLSANTSYGHDFVPGANQLRTGVQNNRFLHSHVCTLYLDTIDGEGAQFFFQHWLTSKVWTTSDFINQYYVLITSTLLNLRDKLTNPKLKLNIPETQWNSLSSFHFFARCCENMAHFSLLNNFKKADADRDIALMLAHEIARVWGDRLPLPHIRDTFFTMLHGLLRSELLVPTMTPEVINTLKIGLFHDLQGLSMPKYLPLKDMGRVALDPTAPEAILERDAIIDRLKQLCQKHNNDKYLEAFAELPLSVETIWKISRPLYKNGAHLMLIGPAGIGKREYVQLTALMHSCMIVEPMVKLWGDSERFLRCMRQAITQAVRSRSKVIFLLSDVHVQDLVYIDLINAFLNSPDCDEVLILDKPTKKLLLQWQRQEYLSDPNNIKYSGTRKEPREEQLMMDVFQRIRKYFHIVITLNSLDQYVSWVGRFPGLESKCDVVFLNEPQKESYIKFTQNYLSSRDVDNHLHEEETLSKQIAFTRNMVRQHIRNNFFKQSVNPASIYEVDESEHLGEVSQLPIRYKTRRPKSPPPLAVKSPTVMSGTNIQKDSKTIDDRQSEVRYEEKKEAIEEQTDHQASLAEDSKEENTSKADDLSPMRRKKKGKRNKKKKKRGKFHRSHSQISSGASDPNLSKQEEDQVYEEREETPFAFQEIGEIIAPEDQKVTEIESDHMCDETLRTLIRNRHIYDKQRIEQLLRSELFPTLNMPSQYVSNYRYVMMLELFRFFYDYFSISLLVRRNYYAGYLKRSREFNEWYIKLGGEKDSLQNQNKELLVRMVTLKRQIDSNKKNIGEKEDIIKEKTEENRSAQNDMNIARKEIKRLTRDKERKMAEAIFQLEKTRPGELKSLAERIKAQKLTDRETRMLCNFNAMVELDESLCEEFPGKSLTSLLENKPDLLERLRNRQEDESDYIPKELLLSIKPFIYESEPEQFTGLLLPLCTALFEWFRKVNLPNSLAGVYEKRNHAKKVIGQNEMAIAYADRYIQEASVELKELEQKYEVLEKKIKYVSKDIEDTEVQHVRTDAIIQTIIESSQKCEVKLKKIHSRIKYLLGDCVVLAASVCFLTPFSLQERMDLRKKLADQIMLCQINSSDNWRNIENEDQHVEIFRDIIDELGYSSLFHQIKGSINIGYFSELLFFLLFSPSTPVVYDSIGQFQKFVKQKLQPNTNMLFASDLAINSRIEQLLSTETPAHLFDLNDFSMSKFHKSTDAPLLSRLAYRMDNGIDEKVLKGAGDKIVLNPSLYHRGAHHNVKIPIHVEGLNLSLHQVTIFSAQPRFDLNAQYASRATILNAAEISKQEAWMEIKQILLKHFLPDKYQQLIYTHQQIVATRQKMQQLQRTFETLFLLSDQDTLRKVASFEALKQCVEAIKITNDSLEEHLHNFNTIINEHPLLASYSNIFVIFFVSLKQLSKLTGEVAYSWQAYLKILDLVIHKILRDLTLDHERSSRKKRKPEDEEAKRATIREFTIEDEFFHSTVMPTLVATVCAGLRQENYPIFTLLFAFEIGIKKGTIEPKERAFFLKHFLVLQGFRSWRREDTHFFDDVLADEEFNQGGFNTYKNDLEELYPKKAPYFFIEVDKVLKAREQKNTWLNYLNIVNKDIFAPNTGKYHYWDTLLKVNLSLLAPDDEFKARLAQFVHQELHPIFDYQFEAPKLHNFIKTASWNLPIALFTSNSINIVNTVCSIASFYSVGLEVVRTDTPPSIQDTGSRSAAQQVYLADRTVLSKDSGSSHLTMNQQKKQLSDKLMNEYPGENDARRLLGEDPLEWQRIPEQCFGNMRQGMVKDSLSVDNKQAQQQQGQSGVPHQVTLELIEKCAINGTWVLISTLKFPSFWFKMASRLEELAKEGKVLNSFRLFVDLQGFSEAEIPASFLFNYCVRFFLTDENNQDMEGFNDIWANIINNEIIDREFVQKANVLKAESILRKLHIDTNVNEESIDMLMPPSTKAQNYPQQSQQEEEKEPGGIDTFDFSSFRMPTFKGAMSPMSGGVNTESKRQETLRVKEIEEISEIIRAHQDSLVMDLTKDNKEINGKDSLIADLARFL